ncbi:MAG: helix-turn-helix domain-containing protein [Anaerolineales bacterium]|nr:helix-turn-helix domain-containing protein [Anaerolineales bacterium]
MSLESSAVAAPSTTANPADLLAEHEAAASLSIAVQTLRNWRWKGEGPRFVKVGKRAVRYRRADLAAFVEAGTSGKVA